MLFFVRLFAAFNAIMASGKAAIQNGDDLSRILMSWGCSSAAFVLILSGTQLALKPLHITTGTTQIQ
jgi:hypothetical protein